MRRRARPRCGRAGRLPGGRMRPRRRAPRGGRGAVGACREGGELPGGLGGRDGGARPGCRTRSVARGPADRPLQDSLSPRQGWDGRSVSRPGHEAGPRRRHQGRGRRLPFGPRAARALRTRGSGAGDAEPPAHRRDLRIGGERRRPRPRARARRGSDARRAPGVGTVADSRGTHVGTTDRGRARSRARQGHHPPRSQSREHQDHARRHRQVARLRTGQGVCGGRIGRRCVAASDPGQTEHEKA